MFMKFSASEIYANLAGRPICSVRGGGDDVGSGEAPEGAPDKVNLVATLFNGSPNLDTTVQVDSVGGNLDTRVHFLRYMTPGSSAGTPDNAESLMHVCHDMLNDPSRIYTTGNLVPSSEDFDASNISRAIRTVFPGMAVNDQNSMAQSLASVDDRGDKYTGIWMRLLALSLALSGGCGTVAALTNATSVAQQIGIAHGPGVEHILPHLNDALQGGVGITFLPVDGAPSLFTDATRRVFAAISMVHVGVATGAMRRSLASLFDDEHRIYFYGSATRMGDTPFGAVLTPADVFTAMRFMMSTTGDIDGLNDALSLLARRVRWYGPNITNLSSPITQRFNNLSAQVTQWFNLFYAAFIRDKSNPNGIDAVLQAAIDAIIPAGVGRARARDGTLARWGTEHQGLRAMGETMVRCGSVERYLLSLTTAEVIVAWERLSTWNLRGADDTATGSWIIQDDLSPGIQGADAALPAGVRAPSWETLEVDQSVSSDGFTAATLVLTCAGVKKLKQFMQGTGNAALAAQRRVKAPMNCFNGMALRRRIYMMAAAIRSCADVVFDAVDSSAAKDEYSEGAANTGNAVVDSMLDYQTSVDDTNFVVRADELFSTVLTEAGYYGLASQDSITDSEVFHYGYDDIGYERGCVRCCFHPSIAKQFLGDDCGRSGGDYNFSEKLCVDIMTQFQEVWSNHKIEGMRTSEVAALMQFIAATKGRSMLYGSWLNVRVGEFGRDVQHMSTFMRNDICRPSENRIDLSVMTPSLWWYRPIYTGQLRLLSVSSQLMSGFNIVDGLRSESDLNTASNALNVLYSGVDVIHTGPARGSGRTRWLMRSNAVASPPPILPIAQGISRDAAVGFTHSIISSINRLSAVSRVSLAPQPYFGKMRPIKIQRRSRRISI